MDKNTNKKPQVKAVPAGEKINNDKKMTIDDKITIKELEGQIESMKKDKEAKCKSAKEQLISMLEVTVDKYRTATGTAEALRILRFVIGDESWIDLSWASRLAWDMAVETEKMKDKASHLTYVEMDKLCDGFYCKEFKIAPDAKNEEAVYELAFEMMRVDLCRNVGGAAEDMVEFIKRVEAEIDATGKKLKELRNKEEK